MPRYKLIVLSNAVKGQEDEYNDWYSNQHLADVVAVQGFSSAQRFKIRSVTQGDLPQKYMAIYEMDAEDPEAAMAHLTSQSNSGGMYVSPALDMSDVVCAIVEVCSEEVRGKKPQPA
jgi:hypothetical protein